MKIAVFETQEWEHEACLRLQPEHEVVCLREALNARTAPAHSDAEAITTFVNSRMDAAVLSRFSDLCLIATRSTGYDHIDLDYCKAHGITVCNVPDYGDATVAEHAFALLLAISRRVTDAVERTRRGDFSQGGLRGFDLRGKILGVIGTGRIGRRAIEIAKGFGMSVLAFDLYPNEDSARALGFRYADLADVLANADALTLHVPATPQTENLISDREFAAMKKGAVLINTARGGIVDVAALVRALNDKKLRAAGLDVLPAEPMIREEAEIFRAGRGDTETDLRALLADHMLLRFPNVLITPHIAFNSEEALARILDTTLENIAAFARAKPQNLVTNPARAGSAPAETPSAARAGDKGERA